MFDYLPRRDDFFPRTKRGHGTTHPRHRFDQDGIKVRDGNPCVDPTCSLHAPKSKNLHRDKTANLEQWCDEHKLSLRHQTAGEAMTHATGGGSSR